MEIEESLKAKCGTRRPFTVPAGYFEQLEARVMERVKAGETAVPVGKTAAPAVVHVRTMPLWGRLMPLVTAACMVGFIVLVGLSVGGLKSDGGAEAPVAHAQREAKAEPYADELDRLADYTMIDEDDVYAYISTE